jgi:hypothetical protein
MEWEYRLSGATIHRKISDYGGQRSTDWGVFSSATLPWCYSHLLSNKYTMKEGQVLAFYKAIKFIMCMFLVVFLIFPYALNHYHRFSLRLVLIIWIWNTTILSCGPGSSVSIATDYGLDGPGIESWWGQDFPPVQTGPGAHAASCTMGTGSFPGVKCGRGFLLTTHHLLAPRSWKSRAMPLPPSGLQLGL